MDRAPMVSHAYITGIAGKARGTVSSTGLDMRGDDDIHQSDENNSRQSSGSTDFNLVFFHTLDEKLKFLFQLFCLLPQAKKIMKKDCSDWGSV
jgi:hypothetical protein